MKKLLLCVVLVMVSVPSAFGDAMEESFLAVLDSNTTPRMIESLIKFGADVNAKDNDGVTVLILAVRNKVINAGVDVNAKDKDGWTALMHAASVNSNPEIAKALINAGGTST